MKQEASASIGGSTFTNGILIIKENFDTNAIDEAIQTAGYDQMRGFCYDCGAYFAIDHINDSGVYFKIHQEEE